MIPRNSVRRSGILEDLPQRLVEACILQMYLCDLAFSIDLVGTVKESELCLVLRLLLRPQLM